MLRFLILSKIILFLFVGNCYAEMLPQIPRLDRAFSIEEIDGSPSGIDIRRLIVSNDSLVLPGDGTAILDWNASIDDFFLRLDGSNANVTIDLGVQSITTMGSVTAQTGLSDGTAVLQFGNLGFMGNISGTDVDITAGTGDYTTTGKVDLGEGTLELPNSASLPGTCVVGETFFDTDATSGQRIYACETTDNWVLQGGGGAESDTLDSVCDRGATTDQTITTTASAIAADIIRTKGVNITYSGGYITTMQKVDGRTMTFTRNARNYVTSATDGTRTWTISRDSNDEITGWTISL